MKTATGHTEELLWVSPPESVDSPTVLAWILFVFRLFFVWHLKIYFCCSCIRVRCIWTFLFCPNWWARIINKHTNIIIKISEVKTGGPSTGNTWLNDEKITQTKQVYKLFLLFYQHSQHSQYEKLSRCASQRELLVSYLQAEAWEMGAMFSLQPTADSQWGSAAPVEPSERTRGGAGIGNTCWQEVSEVWGRRQAHSAGISHPASRAGGNCVGTQPPSAAWLPVSLTGVLSGITGLLTKSAEVPTWSSCQAAWAPEAQPVLSQTLEHLDPRPTTSVCPLHVFTQLRCTGFYSSCDRRFARLLL